MYKFSIRPGQKRNFRKRVATFFSICLFILLLLLFRTAYLQMVLGDQYSRRSKSNRVRSVSIYPNRGEVYDRFQRKLITNRKSFCITILPAAFPEKGKARIEVLERLARVLSISTNKIMDRLRRAKGNNYTPKLIKEGVDFKDITRIAENVDAYPGVFWSNRPVRVYTLTNTLAHVLGYTGAISKKEYKSLYWKGGYTKWSIIGKTGIERIYDMDLRGEVGVFERVVDARNKVTSQQVRREPVNGRPLVLTIDSRLQQIAQNAMGKHRGAVVVSRPATGEVLALVSNPGYNANLFYSRINRKEFLKIYKDPGKPFLNRSIQALYPPSSIFKLITSIAGLETGRFSAGTSYYCDGSLLLGDRYFKCWYGRHAHQSLIDAIMNSCNVYFYKASLAIKADPIFRYAKMFGLGKKTGIDLIGEYSGFVPSRKWMLRKERRPWQDGDTLNLAIGQGYLLVTPIQINVMTAAIYNNGIAYRPYLKKEVRSLRHNAIIERNPGKHLLFRAKVSKKSFSIVKRGMLRVVRGGTGLAAQSPKVLVAGKTGTAQNAKKTSHAWFTCYAPANAKRAEDVIAVTVICENAGGGGAVAAPIAACVIRAHFENKTIQETMQYIWKLWGSSKKDEKKRTHR